MRNTILASVTLLSSLFFLPTLASASTVLAGNEPVRTLSQQDFVALTKPGVVRVIHHVSGKIIVRPFKLDFKTLKISEAPELGKPKEVSIEKDFSGTGFFVTPDGYILTNAHVVSNDFVRMLVAQSALVGRLISQAELAHLSEKDMNKIISDIDALSDLQKMQNAETVLGFIELKNASSTITILNSDGKGSQKIKDLISVGMPATLKQIGEKYPLSDNDVALIKIGGTSFPALPLEENAENVKTGDRVYTFGFPSSADSSTITLDASFTDGTVSARKESKYKTLSLIQTNTKIAEGSSGSPLMNENGSTIGIISMQTADRTLGDSFGFAIPMQVAKSLFEKEGIVPKHGSYDELLREGISLASSRHCKKASDTFRLAEKSVDSRIAVKDLVLPYIQGCDALLAEGKSLDTKWDEYKDFLTNLGSGTWVLIFGAIVASIILVAIIIILLRKLRRDGRQIDQLENMMVRDHFEKEIAASEKIENTAQAVPKSVVVPADLLAYVQQMKDAGSTEERTKAELKKAGWDDAVAGQATGSVFPK